MTIKIKDSASGSSLIVPCHLKITSRIYVVTSLLLFVWITYISQDIMRDILVFQENSNCNWSIGLVVLQEIWEQSCLGQRLSNLVAKISPPTASLRIASSWQIFKNNANKWKPKNSPRRLCTKYIQNVRFIYMTSYENSFWNRKLKA